jgi:GTPase SAR1 family protein
MSEEKEERFPSKRFELKLPDNGGISIFLLGASRSGKSTMLRYLYKTYFSHYITLFLSMNLHADIYRSLGDKMILMDEYHPEILQEMHKINAETGNKFPFLYVNDDFVSHRIKNDAEILRLLTLYRNAGMSSIQSFQGQTLMNPVGRAQVNLVLIFAQNTAREYERVIKEYMIGWIPEGMTLKESVKWMMVATQNHQCVVLDQLNHQCYISKLMKDQLV